MSCSAWKSLASEAAQWRCSAARIVASSISVSHPQRTQAGQNETLQRSPQKAPAQCRGFSRNVTADDAAPTCALVIPRLAPPVLHGIAALRLRHIPTRRAHPENLIIAPRLGGVV